MSVHDKERVARAALARLMEPQDSVGLALVQVVGAVDALRVATGSSGPVLVWSRRFLRSSATGRTRNVGRYAG